MEDHARAQLARALDLPEAVHRSADDRVVAGVCGGLGAALGVDPTVLRLAFAVLAVANGSGLVLYLFCLAFLRAPAGPSPAPEVRAPSAERAAGVALATFGLLLLFAHLRVLLPAEVVWASAVAALGFALVWTRTDAPDRTRWLLLRSAGGGLLVVAGLGGLLAAGGVLGWVGSLGLAVLATSAGVGLLLGPWIVRLLRDLGTERRERIRSEERSEMAAHLHDSVLQTLALIQRADSPGRARTLARRQERELRSWLYGDHAARRFGAEDLSAALQRLVTDVEDAHDVEVDLVLVGSCPMEPGLEALVAAVREAAHNAGRHAGVEEISIYVEVGAESVEAFVRDRGRGFDPAAVEPGRLGIRESIVGRMTRHGGRAEVHSAPGEGTEVALEIGRTVPRTDRREPEAAP
ncbi:MAG: PspC domain-containing protein [Acidimicrobiia bacterium]|jgi:signal transduction histidine kinase